MNRLKITVRYSTGAYNTNRSHGTSGSSTSSPAQAALSLAVKVYGPALIDVVCTAEAGIHSTWEATADEDWFAWCWADGSVEFGDQVPKDAAAFARGPRRALMELCDEVCRHGHRKGALLVPGVPEAEGQRQGMDALLAFVRWCMPRNGKRESFCVQFGTFGPTWAGA